MDALEDRLTEIQKTLGDIDALKTKLRGLLGLDTPVAAPPVVKAERKCGICNESGHNARACPKKEAATSATPNDQLLTSPVSGS